MTSIAHDRDAFPPAINAARRTARSRTPVLIGRAISALAVLFLLFDGVIKLLVATPVVDALTRLGWPVHLAPALGILQLACVALYLAPRTSLLGAVLLTGYLGGAVATHVRIADPLFSHALFPVYVGALAWGGLWLRNPRVRALALARG